MTGENRVHGGIRNKILTEGNEENERTIRKNFFFLRSRFHIFVPSVAFCSKLFSASFPVCIPLIFPQSCEPLNYG